MPDSCAALKETHQPQVLVETAGLSEKEWLAYRRKGIGGSDVAALLGISPWRTARDLYYDKLNIAAVEDNEENWVALEMGHLLEPLVAKIFQHRTGYKIYQVKKMFQHPKYPWMLADVDYFVELPDGTTAILEIKTTNYNAKDHWWLNGEETVPVYYETQGRHYMAVMNVDRCFFCCLYGNNEEETIIREIRRDEAYEDEMIFLEQHFWENYVLAKTPPPYTEEGNLVIESVRRHTGPADKDAPVVTFDYSLTAKLMRYLQLQEEKKHAEKNSKEIDADKQVLKGVTLNIRQGTTTALVGPSGSGKSTIAKLIASYWDAGGGSITIGGVDVKNLPPEQVMDLIGYVSQDNFLFNVSVRENIRMGRPEATDDEVEAVAKASGCHDFIMGLDYGYDTVVGGAGGHLSGGERQRVAIARAMMKNAPIVILDEATSYTDPENEAVIQDAIGRLTHGKTLIVIAHRLSTITDADQIAVVDQGKILDVGTHDELLKRCPLYAQMWAAHTQVKDTDMRTGGGEYV